MKLSRLISHILLGTAPVLCQNSKPTLLRGVPSNDSQPAVQRLLSSSDILLDSSSTCMQFDDEDVCNGSVDENGEKCVWCKCSAIPSECLNVEQSKKAPKGVFDCASPAGNKGVEIAALDSNSNSNSDSDSEYNTISVADDSHQYNPEFFTYFIRDDEVDGKLCDPGSKSLSGYIDISGSKYNPDGGNKHLFYWFFEKRSKSNSYSSEENYDDSSPDDNEIPLVLWLTGGPGCSSTLALLSENGPCKVTEDGQSTAINPHSWTETAHVLWLDQPAGVGYSYGTENDYNEEMISEDAYYFIQEFLRKHPEYEQNPLTIVGESYGGHYAPAVAHKIWLKNKVSNDDMLHINLAGLGIGNGLTNPIEQYKYYPEMAFHNSHGIQVVSEDTYNEMKEAVPKCVALINNCNKGESIINRFACQMAFVLCNISQTTPYQMTGLNPYDIRKECGSHPLCYDFSNIETFLNLDSTRSALHVSEESKGWTSCNMGINMKFHTDWMKDFSPFVADLLNDGIPTLIYAGDVDYICNYLGNKAWTLSMEWKFKENFNASEDHEWGGDLDGNDTLGLARTAHNLTFLQVYDAGHMVPSDQPEVALKMITQFLNGEIF